MSNANLADIRAYIKQFHKDDKQQLKIVFSDSPRLIVEAPAGFGKTTTMISRIAYLLASDSIPNPKRILGLTFSINAALKIKRDVADKLPGLLEAQGSPIALEKKVTITNYHGFCKGILRKYGYLADETLRDNIDLFIALGKIRNRQGRITSEWQDIVKHLSSNEQETIHKIDISIENRCMPSGKDIQDYLIIIRKLLNLNYITHNAVILFVLDILERFPEMRKFYQSYYPLIVVDEFQDTNCIAWKLLESIIVYNQTKLVFLGDPLQRIYGFIGALPNIMAIANRKYNMAHMALSKNHRFQNNPEMLKLDKNIRANAAASFTPTIGDDECAQLPAFWGANQQEEAQKVAAKVLNLITDSTDKVAILFRARGVNADIVESELSCHGVPYFYGMFTEDDPEYVNFHIKCQKMFVRRFDKSKIITYKSLQGFTESVKSTYATVVGKTIDSLLHLLDALVAKVSVDYADIQSEYKYELLLGIFENRQIKQAMEYVDSQVVLSTVHGAKGLEWDYVILADLERWVFPMFVCGDCPNKYVTPIKCCCQLPKPVPKNLKKTVLDELSVFYVGITRARKQVFVSGSARRYNAQREEKRSNFSCFASIKGIHLINAESAQTTS